MCCILLAVSCFSPGQGGKDSSNPSAFQAPLITANELMFTVETLLAKEGMNAVCTAPMGLAPSPTDGCCDSGAHWG